MDIIKIEPREGDIAFAGANVVGQGEVKSVARDIKAPCEAFSTLIYHRAGSRCQWHTHEIIQIIHVVEGGGWIQVRGEEPARLEEGDTVVARPGEEHWHGAPPRPRRRAPRVHNGRPRLDGSLARRAGSGPGVAMRIGFIGAGNMGTPMIANFVTAGYTVTAHDVQPEIATRVSQVGAGWAQTASAAAAGAEAVFMSLPGPPQVRSVVLADGLADALETKVLPRFDDIRVRAETDPWTGRGAQSTSAGAPSRGLEKEPV